MKHIKVISRDPFKFEYVDVSDMPLVEITPVGSTNPRECASQNSSHSFHEEILRREGEEDEHIWVLD